MRSGRENEKATGTGIVEKQLIVPKQKDEALLNDILSSDPGDGFCLWWLGQSGFLLRWEGKHLLFDPYLSDSLTRKYQHTDKPHVRMSERVIAPEKLSFVDIVTSSHNHTDHLDAETLIPLLQANPDIRLIIPEANRAFVAERTGCPVGFPEGLNDGLVFRHLGFEVHGVPAAHNEPERNGKGECIYMGFVVRFGGFTVYHSGDTLLYEGIEELLRGFDPDVALLPVNGNKPERRVAGNLNAAEAAKLAKSIGARLVLPHHYHMFEFNTADPGEFARECEREGVNYRIPALGEKIVYTK